MYNLRVNISVLETAFLCQQNLVALIIGDGGRWTRSGQDKWEMGSGKQSPSEPTSALRCPPAGDVGGGAEGRLWALSVWVQV